eukprot:GILJ01016989.1.p1 GENE.GILJ01016989.1~~GILJ01016989.1.p1  ORF type:complete len:364 (-),score=31.96 GILJ01016989.1:67-1158(-)
MAISLTAVISFIIIPLLAMAFGSDPLRCQYQQQDEISLMFQQHRDLLNKQYPTCDEASYREKVFRENHLLIEQHNARQDTSYRLGHNQFSDWTEEEFQQRMLSGSKWKVDMTNIASLVGDAHHDAHHNRPDSVDWRKAGCVTPVKDQGQCGSCFAHSAVAAIESLWCLGKISDTYHGELLTLSEQQVVDCSVDMGNEGCNGGRMEGVFEYATHTGLETAADYPYKAVDQKCSFDASKARVKIGGWKGVPKGDEAALQEVVATQPVSIAIEANALQFYHSGVFDGVCGHSLNHGVTVVGYGSTDKGADYWTVKNSWGAGWGEDGYVRMRRQTTTRGPGQCGLALDASFPLIRGKSPSTPRQESE